MRINSLSYNGNSSFKARLSPKVEAGFWFLGEDIEYSYGKDSTKYQKYKQGMADIKNLCPKYIVDEIRLYNKNDIECFDLVIKKFPKKPVAMRFNSYDNEEELYSMKTLSVLVDSLRKQDAEDNMKKELRAEKRRKFFSRIKSIFK